MSNKVNYIDMVKDLEHLESVSSSEELCQLQNSIFHTMFYDHLYFDDDDIEQMKTQYPEKIEKIDELYLLIQESRKAVKLVENYD